MNEEQKETSGFQFRGERQAETDSIEGYRGDRKAKVEGSVSARQMGKEEARNRAKGCKGWGERRTRELRDRRIKMVVETETKRRDREDREERNENERERECVFAERWMSRCESSNTEGETRMGTK